MENNTADNQHIAGLVFRHLTSCLNGEDAEDLARWVQSSPENRRLLDDLENPETFLRLWKKYESFNPAEGWRELQNRLPALRWTAYDGTYDLRASVGFGETGRSRWHWLPWRRLIGGFILFLALVVCPCGSSGHPIFHIQGGHRFCAPLIIDHCH